MLAWWLVACRVDGSAPEPLEAPNIGPPEPPAEEVPPPPPDAPCDGEGIGEDDCTRLPEEADLLIPGLSPPMVADLGGDGTGDFLVGLVESGGSYHATWRDHSVEVHPDVLGGADPFVITSRASVSEYYYGTDTGVTAVTWTADATGDGVPDAWFQTPDGAYLVPGPLHGPGADPQLVGVAHTVDPFTVADLDRDGVGEVLFARGDVRCEGPFAGEVATRACPTYNDYSTLPLAVLDAAHDVDRDGIDDLLRVELRSEMFLVVRSGADSSEIASLARGRYNNNVVGWLADFDGDGHVDLLSVNPEVDLGDQLPIFRGPLAGALGEPDLRVTGESLLPLGVGDLEGDGAAEIVLTVASGGGAWVIHPDVATGKVAVESIGWWLANDFWFRVEAAELADLDGDGRDDVLLSSAEELAVYLSASLVP